MIKSVGIELPKGNKKAIATATVAKKAGRTKESIKAQLIEMDNLPEVEAEQIVTEIMNRKEFDINNNAKDPEDLIPALVEWLQMNHPLRLNTIYLRARIFFNSKEITKDLIESVVFSDNIPQFNPIQEWIEKHRHLKSSGNINKLCATITTDTTNANIWIRKWFLSLIAAYDGNPVRSVLALVGGQHTGKTEWFRRLLPDELRKYYAESKLDAGKDDEILMCQKLIVMDDEMGGKSKQDEKRFKELTSKHTFTLRAPYGRYNEDYKRLAVLCGTSNPIEILSDPTGNTRILPVHVLAINHDLYNSINKSEMLMETVRAYESGEQWQLNKSEFDDLNMQSLEYEKTPFERELIIKHLRKPEKDEYYKEMTATEIKNYIEGNSMQRIMNMTRFGIELKNVFGKSKMLRKNGVVSRYYDVVTADVTGLHNEPVTPQSIDNEDDIF
jgi:predicted P-loop ATPase